MERAERNFQAALDKLRSGDLAGSEKLCREVLAFRPQHVEALHLLSVIFAQTGRQAEALQRLDSALALAPGRPDFHTLAGAAHSALGRRSDAVAAYRRAASLAPNHPATHLNLAQALLASGAAAEAIPVFERAIATAPQLLGAHLGLASALNAVGKSEQAADQLRALVLQQPAAVEISLELAAQQAGRKQWSAVRDTLEAALRRAPDDPRLLFGCSSVQRELGNLDAAEAALRRILTPAPTAAACRNVAAIVAEQGRIDEAILLHRQAVDLEPDRAEFLSGLIFATGLSTAAPEETLELAWQWDRRFGLPLRPAQPHYTIDCDPARRLRIGYVSSDLRHHPVGYCLLPILRAHDRTHFEIFCYANHVASDELTARLQTASDHWRSIAGQPDDQVARHISDDRIDILIDLGLHSPGNRLLVFARQPAPVQMTYLGYPGTTGLSAIQYRFSDPALDPDPRNDRLYSETTLRLPQSYWCYSPTGDYPEPLARPPFEDAGHVTFGCLNSFSKVSTPVLQLWARVLAAVPGSRLIVRCPAGNATQRVRDIFQSTGGIEANRIETLPQMSWEHYLQTYQRIDIALDPFPYGGGITTFDSLWMGVPVLTRPGATATSRGAASILTTLGLPDWIATGDEDLVERAVHHARNAEDLRTLRQSLRPRLQQSVLCDGRALAGQLEAAYRQAWHTCCAEAVRGA